MRVSPRRPLTSADFSHEVERTLTPEKPYAYHERLTTEDVHLARRCPAAQSSPPDAVLPRSGWRLVFPAAATDMLAHALHDFQDYLRVSLGVETVLAAQESLADWAAQTQCVVIGTQPQMPGIGSELQGSKDYQIVVSEDRIAVCGFDERGAMHGLYHLEARLNLGGRFLPNGLNTVRHSLYDTRMVLSWMGWMEWPDTVLSHLAHDGFDAIFASVYANPNGDRTTAEASTDFYARLLHRVRPQNPARIRDLIDRAARYGIKVYAPIVYQYLGTPESEEGLRKLVREILREFPDIRGYVLLTEGFWYGKWGGGHGAGKEYLQDWARNWTQAVAVVAEECHAADPAIEVLPWEYNIDFRPQNAEMKRYFIEQLPDDTIPLLTWENGKSFEIDGMQGFLRDYSLNQVGPAEVTDAQIDTARRRGMKVYCKADSFASWQFGTIPYLPFPYQWHRRYEALAKYGVDGTLESWSSGYKPNWVAELRAWTCWTDAPPLDELLGGIAARIFGEDAQEDILAAWRHFSEAIRLVPDTGPRMGTNSAVGNPLFFEEPPVRTATYKYSWSNKGPEAGYLGNGLIPYWPFTVFYLVFCPDFTNRTNRAEQYTRTASGVQPPEGTAVLPVFLKYLRGAAAEMEKGLVLYRAAALRCAEDRRPGAMREVVVAEQLRRMIESNCAILEFEDLRMRFVVETDRDAACQLLDRMEAILHEETARTEESLVAAEHDSRLGFQFEQDYVYTPYSLREKLRVLHDTLERQLPHARGARTAGPH